MNKKSRLNIKKISAIVFLANIISFVGLLLFIKNPSVAEFDLQQPIRLMVLSTHQDDGVISAGGLAIRNSKLSGQTSVLYLTRPIDDVYAKTRRAEANRAWEFLPGEKAQLYFMDFLSQRPWDEVNISVAEKRLERYIKELAPSHIVIPAKERGHYEHDLYGVIASSALKNFPEVKIFRSSEYNPIYRVEKTPRKLLQFLLRLMPYVPYEDINVGLDPANQVKVKLSESELELKKQMLLAFVSQQKTIPLAQFGYTDLFDDTNIDELNLVFFLGKYFSRWSLMALFIFVLSFFCLGLSLASWCKHKKYILVFASVSIVASMACLLFSVALFKEEGIIYAVFTLGLCFGLSDRFLYGVANS